MFDTNILISAGLFAGSRLSTVRHPLPVIGIQLTTHASKVKRRNNSQYDSDHDSCLAFVDI